jgi:hypothetical protein
MKNTLGKGGGELAGRDTTKRVEVLDEGKMVG